MTVWITGLESDMVVFAQNTIMIDRMDNTSDKLFYPFQQTTIILRSSHAFNLYLTNAQISSKPIQYFNGIVRYDWVLRLFVWSDVSQSVIRIVNASQIGTTYAFPFRSDHFMGDMVLNVEKSVLVMPVMGDNPRLEQCNYDGSNQTVLFTGLGAALHLTIDYQTQRYFFVDVLDDTFQSIDFDGNDQRLHLRSFSYSIGLKSFDVYNNDLYYMTKYSHLMKKYEIGSLVNGTPSTSSYSVKPFRQTPEKLFGFMLLKQNYYFANKCQPNQCSHLCLPTVHSFRCVCPTGYALTDRFRCTEDKRFQTSDSPIEMLEHVKPVSEGLTSSDGDSERLIVKLENIATLENMSNKNLNFNIVNLVLIMINFVVISLLIYM